MGVYCTDKVGQLHCLNHDSAPSPLPPTMIYCCAVISRENSPISWGFLTPQPHSQLWLGYFWWSFSLLFHQRCVIYWQNFQFFSQLFFSMDLEAVVSYITIMPYYAERTHPPSTNHLNVGHNEEVEHCYCCKHHNLLFAGPFKDCPSLHLSLQPCNLD